MRRLLLFASVLLAGCGEAVQDDHFANDVKEEPPVIAAVEVGAVPVRIGELGPSFPACSAAGTTRNLAAGATLPVRSAPFDTSDVTGQIPAGGRFHVCNRSHDQKWFGVVYAAEGAAAADCGVSVPVTSRQAYEGSCRSGWVSSPFVKLTAGIEAPDSPETAK